MQEKKRFHSKSARQQDDCGVFTAQFLEFVSRRAPFYFTSIDMYHLRNVMRWELLKKTLLPRPVNQQVPAIPLTGKEVEKVLVFISLKNNLN